MYTINHGSVVFGSRGPYLFLVQTGRSFGGQREGSRCVSVDIVPMTTKQSWEEMVLIAHTLFQQLLGQPRIGLIWQ